MSVHVLSFAPSEETIETRTAAPFEVNIPAVFGRSRANPWRHPSVREALGVPAVFKAVKLISNTAGALSMNGYRNGERVAPDTRPRLIVRPNPLTVPRVFFRDSAYWKATRGESWLWVAARDLDGVALSVVPIPPYEVTVEEDPHDLRYPIIRWRNRKMVNKDMILDTLQPDPDNPLRGVGPLQLCGAAVSVAVEAQEWAANFYAQGGFPSVYLQSDTYFDDEDEPEKIKERWTATPPNMPHVLTPGLTPGSLPVSTDGSQMLSARIHNHGEVALMFGIPGSLMEYTQSGSSLTYQNVGQRFRDFLETCLWPDYLEGLEQTMSDLLPRTWTAEFDTDRFTRPDPKTRMEVHQIAIDAGIYDAEYAQALEGIRPGNIETAPVPLSPPGATPPLIELRTAAEPSEVRCDGIRTLRSNGVSKVVPCGKLLSKDGRVPERCPRCKKEYTTAA